MACVYILTNPAIPSLLKIGYTGGTAHDRAADISRGTGVPTPYSVHWFIECHNADCAYSVEQATHRALASHRHNRAREFFTCSDAVAIDTIERIAHQQDATPTENLALIQRIMQEDAEREAATIEAAAREAAAIDAKRHAAEIKANEHRAALKAEIQASGRRSMIKALLRKLDAHITKFPLIFRGLFGDYIINLEGFRVANLSEFPAELLPSSDERCADYFKRLNDEYQRNYNKWVFHRVQ